MPVTDIRKLGRNTTQTWEEAFESVDKTSEAFHDLVEEFVKFVGDWKEFSDVRRDRMSEYIEGLDDVKGHWSDINKWISDNSDTLETYVGSLSDIKTLFQDISSEIGGIRRQTLDRVNVIRNLSRLANESLIAAKQEGGLTESSVRSLQKKSTLLIGQYETQLRIMGVSSLEDDANAEKVRKEEERRVQILERQVEVLETLKNSGQRLQASDISRLRYLKEQLDFHKVQLEYVNQTSRDAVQGLDNQIKRQTELFRIQRSGVNAGPNALGANRVDVASRVLRKVGMGEEAAALGREYGEWITNRVGAQQSLENATSARDLAKQSLDAATADRNAALNKAGSFTRESNADIAKFEAEKAKSLAENQQLQQQLASLRSARYKIGTNPDEETGRYRGAGGRFVETKKVKDLDKALQSTYQKLQNNQKVLAGIDTSIKYQKDLQEKYNQELSTTQKLLNSAQVAFEEAEENQQKAQKEKDEVFGKEFDLTGKIVENFRKGYLELGKWGGPLGAIIALAGVLFHHLLQFDKQAVETKRVIGQWADYTATANTKFVSGVEVLKTMVQLGQQFKINPAQVFSPEELANITKAQKFTGMTAEAAGNLAVQSKISGQNASTYRDAIAKGASSANALNHSAVNLSAVQNDVLNTSRAIALSYGNSTKALAEAAGTAASLGMNLQQVEDIAKNLMNFESSIQAEMQAQLLTGMQLNLAKAREYALNNDLEGVAREISNQGMDAAKFSHMNYIQQENMAKALGMSREQMSKMLIMQKINQGLTAEQVAAMTNMRKEDIEALSAQEKWQTMKQKFLETLVPLLEPILQVTTEILRPLAGIVGFITKIIGFVLTLGGITEKWPTWLRGIFVLGVTGLTAWIVKGGALLALGTKIGGVFGKIGGVFAKFKIPAFGGIGAGAAGVEGAGGAFTAVGKSWSSILKGAAAVGIMVAAIAGLGWALKQFKEVGLREIGVAAAGIGVLAGAMIALGLIMNGPLAAAVLLGAAVLGTLTLMVSSLAKSFQKLTAVPGDELESIAVGIKSIAGAVGELSTKIAGLDGAKLNKLGKALKKLKGAHVQVSSFENTGESQEIRRDSLAATAQTITIQQAQVQAAAQQISVEQKATDLSRVEKKIDNVISTIVQSRPDWNWLEFGKQVNLHLQ